MLSAAALRRKTFSRRHSLERGPQSGRDGESLFPPLKHQQAELAQESKIY